jgi:hypothetical protein
MKQIPLLLALLATLVSTTPLCSAPPKDRPDTKIEGQMEEMGGAFRKLRKQVSDPAQNASSLELLAKIKAGALESVKYVPLRAATITEKDRDAWVAAYRKQLTEFTALVTKTEDALKAGDNAGAAKLVDKLHDAEKAGHKDYKTPDAPKKK